MTAPAPFSASRRKIARALGHIAELDALIVAHRKTHPSRWEHGFNEQGLFIKTYVPGPPDGAGEIVGDVVHNLRAALDLLAVDLVRVAGGNTKSVYFPFCETDTDLDEIIKRRNFHRAGDAAVGLLKQLAPYRGGNDALRALHDLDIQDKHHTLIPMTSLATTPQVGPVIIDGKPLIVDGKLKLQVIPPGPEFDAFDVSFPDEYPFARRPIVPALHDLVQMVEGIVEAFSALAGIKS